MTSSTDHILLFHGIVEYWFVKTNNIVEWWWYYGFNDCGLKVNYPMEIKMICGVVDGGVVPLWGIISMVICSRSVAH